MKSNKKTFILTEAVLAFLVLLLALFMVLDKRGESLGKVSVIVQNPDDNRWSAFKYGLDMAAKDHKIDLLIVSTGDMQTVEEEKRIIEREIEKGAEAVIVEPIPREGIGETLTEVSKDVPIMLVGQGVPQGTTEPAFPITEPKQYELGESIGKEILGDYPEGLQGKTVGVVSDTTDSEAASEREAGFRDVIEGAGAVVQWIVSGDFGDSEGEFLRGQPKTDMVAALDDNSLVMLGKYASSEDGYEGNIYGIGNSTEAIYYLDTGIVKCLAVPDEFNVGYQSLTAVAEKLKHSSKTLRDQAVSHTVIRRDELFLQKNQEILFTMSQ